MFSWLNVPQWSNTVSWLTHDHYFRQATYMHLGGIRTHAVHPALRTQHLDLQVTMTFMVLMVENRGPLVRGVLMNMETSISECMIIEGSDTFIRIYLRIYAENGETTALVCLGEEQSHMIMSLISSLIILKTFACFNWQRTFSYWAGPTFLLWYVPWLDLGAALLEGLQPRSTCQYHI